jgi:hypothetical protein
MAENQLQLWSLPGWGETDKEIKQTLEWSVLADEEPPETETVVLATEQSLALGYIDLEGNQVIEYMPLGQEECEHDGPEFIYWMPLPRTPVGLKHRTSSLGRAKGE